MIIRAIPREWIDVKTREILSFGFQFFNGATNTDRVYKFERGFADYIGTKGAVSFYSCRAGMYFSLEALKSFGLEKGDEIILPAFNFWANAAIVILAGFEPVLVDVDFNTGNIDYKKIEEKITKKTKAIFVTHLNGIPADMKPIMKIARKHNLRVLEDSARSCGIIYNGKKVGSFDIGCFSFGYAKTIYLFGGGMVTSDDEDFIERLKSLKSDFKNKSVISLFIQLMKGCALNYLNNPSMYGIILFPLAYEYQINGNERYNWIFKIRIPPYDKVPDYFRENMTNLQAEQGVRNLKRVEDSNKKRMDIFDMYNKELSNIPGLHILKGSGRSTYCPIWSEKKKELQKFLLDNRIDIINDSALDITQMDRFKKYKGDYPNASLLHGKIMRLPMHPILNVSDINYIIDKVKEFHGGG